MKLPNKCPLFFYKTIKEGLTVLLEFPYPAAPLIHNYLFLSKITGAAEALKFERKLPTCERTKALKLTS